MIVCLLTSVVEAKEGGVSTNYGKTTYLLQTGNELAKTCEVDLELFDNEVTVTPVCHLVKFMRS